MSETFDKRRRSSLDEQSTRILQMRSERGASEPPQATALSSTADLNDRKRALGSPEAANKKLKVSQEIKDVEMAEVQVADDSVQQSRDRSESKEPTDEKKSEKGILIGPRKKLLPFSAINSLDRSGRSPIFKYAINGDVEACTLLLKNGAELSIKDHAGWTPLHEACLNGHTDICQLFLEYGADPNASGDGGDTCLHDAVSNGHEQVVKLLLEYGASLSIKNAQEQTPQELAKSHQHIEQFLAEWIKMNDLLDKRDENGRSVIHEACEKGDLDQLLKLLKFGADLEQADNAGWTALHEATCKGHSRLVETLLMHDANVNAIGSEKSSALHVACRNGHLNCAKLLLEYGADTELEDAKGSRAIDYVQSDDVFIAELLKSHSRKNPLFKRRQVSNRGPLVMEQPTERISTVAQNRQLSREERKILAAVRKIESLENQQPSSQLGSYYVGYSGYEEYEANRLKRKTQSNRAKPKTKKKSKANSNSDDDKKTEHVLSTNAEPEPPREPTHEPTPVKEEVVQNAPVTQATVVPPVTQAEPAKFVVKKAKRKSFLGDLSIDDGSILSAEIKDDKNPLVPITPIVSIKSPTLKTADQRKQCLPLYTFYSSNTRYVLDLQLGMMHGHSSGRSFLDEHPELKTRLATVTEKLALENSLLSVTLLEWMKAVHGEERCKWTKKTKFTIDGSEHVGMKLELLDLSLVEYSSVVHLADVQKAETREINVF